MRPLKKYDLVGENRVLKQSILPLLAMFYYP